jgi:hypothetical protein
MKKTDEAMEVGFPDIKLKNIFIFDIIMAKKPMFATKDAKVEQKLQENQ